MKCYSCGAEIPGDSKFCPSCGKSQVQQPAQVCGNCGQKIGAGQVFCSSCGAKAGSAGAGAVPPPPPPQPGGPPPQYTAPVPPPPPAQSGTPSNTAPAQPPPQANMPPPHYNVPPQFGPPSFPGTNPVVPEMGVGVGFRAVATIIDLVILMILSYIIAAIFGTTTSGGFELMGTSFFLTCGVGFAYYLFFEGTLGATPGKLVTGLRVLKADGSKCDIAAAAVRTAFRLIDGFLFYLVAAILVWTSPRRQRLGDRVANTMVVKGNKMKFTRVGDYNNYNFDE